MHLYYGRSLTWNIYDIRGSFGTLLFSRITSISSLPSGHRLLIPNIWLFSSSFLFVVDWYSFSCSTCFSLFSFIRLISLSTLHRLKPSQVTPDLPLLVLRDGSKQILAVIQEGKYIRDGRCWVGHWRFTLSILIPSLKKLSYILLLAFHVTFTLDFLLLRHLR